MNDAIQFHRTVDTLDDGDVAAEVGKLLTQLLGKAVPPPDTVHRYAWTKDEYTLVRNVKMNNLKNTRTK